MTTIDPELRANLARLAASLAILETEGLVFGEWVDSTEREPGIWTMPYVRYGDAAHAFTSAAVGWVRPDIDWGTWAQTDEAHELERDPSRIAAATPEQIAHMLTTVIRGDRFNEGNLLHAFETGLLARIARRAATLASDARALEEALAVDAASKRRILDD